MRESKFRTLLDGGHFAQAATLLKQELQKAEFVDPRDDYSWGPASDVLGYRILAEEGVEAFKAYWLDLLEFFQNKLEPEWGHLHKGHLFFRLGLARLAEGADAATPSLQQALEEDRMVAERVAGDMGLKVEALVHRFPSYVTLCILERIPEDYFSSSEDLRKFYRGLVPLRFDVIWDRKEVELSLVRQAIGVLVPEPGREQALTARQELQLVSAQELSGATLSLVNSFLEAVLFNILYWRLNVQDIDGISIYQADLSGLLREATRRHVFPREFIQSTCQLAHLIEQQVCRPGSRVYHYSLNPATIGYIGYSLKILLDSALVDWAKGLD